MTAPLTDAELAEIRALADGATPGPWSIEDWSGEHPDQPTALQAFAPARHEWEAKLFAADAPPGMRPIRIAEFDPDVDADAAFIAASRYAVPRLLDLIAHQRAALRGKTFSGESPVVVEAERDELRREVERLRNIEAKATKLAASVETMMPALKTGWPRASQDLLDALDAYRKEAP